MMRPYLQIAVMLAALALAARWAANPCDPMAPMTTAAALQRGAQEGDCAAIAKALKDGAAIEARDAARLTPLMLAARAGKMDAVKMLLARGASVCANSRITGSALACAVRMGKVEVARELLLHRADPNERSSDGYTPLWVAAGAPERSMDVVNLLIEYGARVDAVCGNGETALTAAENAGHADVARLLRSKMIGGQRNARVK